jgi:hypothetical protein
MVGARDADVKEHLHVRVAIQPEVASTQTSRI